MRFVSMLAWVVIVVAVVAAVFRRLSAPRPRRAALSDELVKDPVCHTYVARGRAVRLMAAGEPVYFCSDRCARRYTPAGG
jgi:YHS domain-containing protein